MGDFRRASLGGEIILLLPAYPGAAPDQQHPSDQMVPQPDIAIPPMLKRRKEDDLSTDTTSDTSRDRVGKAGRETREERKVEIFNSPVPLSPMPDPCTTLCRKKQVTPL